MNVGALSWSMIREHRWAYAGLAIVLIASSTLVSVSMLLFQAAGDQNVDVAGLTRNEAAIRLTLMQSGRDMAAFMVGLGAFVAVFLVMQTMSFVVDGRRRELALLRLTGASPRQLTAMVLGESAILALVCSVVGAVLSLPLVTPAANLLVQSNNWAPRVPAPLQPTTLIWGVALMTLVTIVGAFLAARKIARTPPVDAVRAVSASRKLMPPLRWVLAGIGAILTLAFMFLPGNLVDSKLVTALAGGGAVLLVTALAPLIVPATARVIGGALTVVAPGAALVAKEHTTHDARRTAALATPIIILLGLGAVFGTVAQQGRAESFSGLEELTNVHAVVETDTSTATEEAFTQAAALPEVGAITRVQRTEAWSWNDPTIPPSSVLDLMVVDTDTLDSLAPPTLLAGSLDDVTGTDIAVVYGMADIGDELRLEAPDGAPVTVRVVAAIEPTSFFNTTLLVGQEGFDLESGHATETWLAAPSPSVNDDQLVSALNDVTPTGSALTRDAWIDQTVASGTSGQQTAIFTLIGGAAILALFTLAQSTLTSVRERRTELTLLTRIGASSRSANGAITIESAITSATAALLAVIVTALVALRMGTALSANGSPSGLMVPIGILSITLLTCLIVSTVSSALGAFLALRNVQLQR